MFRGIRKHIFVKQINSVNTRCIMCQESVPIMNLLCLGGEEISKGENQLAAIELKTGELFVFLGILQLVVQSWFSHL